MITVPRSLQDCRWAAAHTFVRDPYPCRCHSTQGCKQVRNPTHCPCHGRIDVHDDLPLHCCARNPHQPPELEVPF